MPKESQSRFRSGTCISTLTQLQLQSEVRLSPFFGSTTILFILIPKAAVGRLATIVRGIAVPSVMDSPSIICTTVGMLIISVRSPLVFAPSATLRFYDRLFLSTNARFRGLIGITIFPLAMMFILLPLGERELGVFLRVAGCGIAAVSLWAFVLPNKFRQLVRAKNSFFEHAVPTSVLRILGALATLAGVALIYIGAGVV